MNEKNSKKYNILVAEDESLSLEMLVNILESNNLCHCIPAKNGIEALEIYKNMPIDFTFLDINMPELNGIETLKQIKLINKDAIVVMQTASGELKLVKEAIAAGASTYIVKPYQPERILNAFEKFIELKRQ